LSLPRPGIDELGQRGPVHGEGSFPRNERLGDIRVKNYADLHEVAIKKLHFPETAIQ
jgi:hypothetical protein